MDQDVSESRDGPPVNLGMKGSQTITSPLGGFGEGLEVPQNSVLNQFRLAKGVLTALAIPVDTPDAIEDVLDIEPVVLHKEIAS
jgi:hypothetical protein